MTNDIGTIDATPADGAEEGESESLADAPPATWSARLQDAEAATVEPDTFDIGALEPVSDAPPDA